jgi:hypothetical protein
MTLVSVGPNQGTETVTRDTTYKSAGTYSYKCVTAGNLAFEGIFGPFAGSLGRGMTVPAMTPFDVSIDVAPMSGIELRVVVNCYDSSDELVFVTPEVFVTGTATGAFHNAAFSLPQLATDCYAQVSVTNGSDGDTMASTTFWVDQVSFKVGTVTTVTAPTLVAGFPVKLTPASSYCDLHPVDHSAARARRTLILLIEHHYDDQARPINGPGAGSKPTFNSSVMTLVNKPTPGSGRPNVEAWGNA